MKILQVIDSLDAGGAERMAVSIANELAAHGYDSHLCVTRAEGLLKKTIEKKVGYIFLNRKGKLGIRGLYKLYKYVKKNDITHIHAHATSFFLAGLIKKALPSLIYIWHDHYGNAEQLQDRPQGWIKWASNLSSQNIVVNELLLEWHKNILSKNNAIYLKNFAQKTESDTTEISLPGKPGKRIIHLANLRPQKDHLNLLQAFEKIESDWDLILVGKDFNDDYSEQIKNYISSRKLENRVHILGARNEIGSILDQCDIGVLSSKSEGLPVALLEYGLYKLPVITTNVGACKKVVESYGKVVAANQPLELSNAIEELINSKEEREQLGTAFNKHVLLNYGATSYINQLVNLYKSHV
ncbi:glycosyltransferase [Nonlabens sp. SCSIO 43208]|uniref:glycosyltransferase n=1 Tax=Nonlabens sp. SCSIO 43208 TaxID=2793009 RepID=UPI003D6A88A6